MGVGKAVVTAAEDSVPSLFRETSRKPLRIVPQVPSSAPGIGNL
jgi:hypothetical protein